MSRVYEKDHACALLCSCPGSGAGRTTSACLLLVVLLSSCLMGVCVGWRLSTWLPKSCYERRVHVCVLVRVAGQHITRVQVFRACVCAVWLLLSETANSTCLFVPQRLSYLRLLTNASPQCGLECCYV